MVYPKVVKVTTKVDQVLLVLPLGPPKEGDAEFLYISAHHIKLNKERIVQCTICSLYSVI